MIIPIAWKNIWRKKSRSLIVIIAVTIGTFSGMFFSAWMQGMFDQKVHDSIYTEVGHLKIINPHYLINEDIKDTIPNLKSIEKVLNKEKGLKSWVSRSKVICMATATRKSAGVTLIGIDPKKEKKVSNLYSKIIPGTGDYFESKSRIPTIIIGEKLAEELKIKTFIVTKKNCKMMKHNGIPDSIINRLDIIKGQRFSKRKFDILLTKILNKREIENYSFQIKNSTKLFIRSKITFTFTNSKEELAYLTCRVNGIFKTNNNLFDIKNVFIEKNQLAEAAGLSINQCHEISILAEDDLNAENTSNVQPLKNKLQKLINEASVVDLQTTAPDAYSFQLMSKPMMFVIMFLIYFALAFGIINTMLMAIIERVKEFGMLHAIGMKKQIIAKMILFETLFLTFIGTSIGLLLTFISIEITSKTGISLFSESFEEVGFSSIIYPKLTIDFFCLTLLIIFCVSLLASIIPIHKALKIKSIVALKNQ